MKRFFLLLFLGILVAGYIFLGPFRTLWGIHSAVEAQSEEQLERYIDFPAVRESLKEQLEAKIERETAYQKENLAMYLLFSQLVPQVSDTLVDEFLNIESIGDLMHAAKNNSVGDSSGEDPSSDASIKQNIEAVLEVFEFNYIDWNFFEIRVKDSHSEFSDSRILFQRTGLNWPIVAIELPGNF